MLGRQLWASMLEQPIPALLPREVFHQSYSRIMTRELARGFWQSLSREQVLQDVEALRASGLTLGEVLGREASALLRAGAQNPGEPNRELLEQLLDQPILRQALRNMVQKTIQQFVSQLRMPGGSGGSGDGARGSVLGALGRTIASRAEKAAQIGKTFVEGVGGTLYRQVEEQLQPFMSSFMSRSVKLLTEGIFDGSQQESAIEARLGVLEILLKTEMQVLLPPPNHRDLKQNLGVIEAICVHTTGFEAWQRALLAQLDGLYDSVADETLGQAMERFGLNAELDEAACDALGAMAYTHLSSTVARDFLQAELAAVWPG